MDLNTALELLADRYRREIFFTLNEQNPKEGLPAARTAHFGERDLDEVKVEMKHIHLPKLEEANIIDVRYEETDDYRVKRGKRFSEIQSVITAVETAKTDVHEIVS